MQLHTLALAVVLGMIAYAADRVTVYLSDESPCSAQERLVAQRLASAILRNADVEIDWRVGKLRPSASGSEIAIEITSATDPSFFRGALAYSRPFEGIHVRVFYDRVRQMMPEPYTQRLLGHAMAHELVHVLQGTDRHADSGLLKASWNEADRRAMILRPLVFEELDIHLVQRGMEERRRIAAK